MNINTFELTYLLILVVILFSFTIKYYYNTSDDTKTLISKNFYEVNEVESKLNNIYQNINVIKNEVQNIIQHADWIDWPETNLYDGREDLLNKTANIKHPWTIFPFFAFDTIVSENCKKCPNLWNFIKSIPSIRLATLSKLAPGTKLNTHQGWGKHSNNVIRCHFGFNVPYGCCISVRKDMCDDEEIRMHRNNQWLLFDDSRYHYAYNPTKRSRIILIIDVDRPSNIKTGSSEIGDTKELIQIVEYFRYRGLGIVTEPEFII